jgi:acetyltransferase-like isoleucine patch superfamily enzyme
MPKPMILSRLRHAASVLWSRVSGPCMVYGHVRHDGQFLAHTRVGNTTYIEAPGRLDIRDHVFIGQHNFIDASNGLMIDEGCQITNHVSILTHSSHIALRLHGRSYHGNPSPIGYRRAATQIGAYVFVGPNVVVAPGSRIGKGALIRAFSYVSGEVPDFAVMSTVTAGQPAVQVGDTRALDAPWLNEHPGLRAHYDAWAKN